MSVHSKASALADANGKPMQHLLSRLTCDGDVFCLQSQGTQQLVASHLLYCQNQSAGLSKGMFVSQQLIPASSGFDHNSAQKDVRHFPAIQVSCHSFLPCKYCVLPCKYSELPLQTLCERITSWCVFEHVWCCAEGNWHIL